MFAKHFLPCYFFQFALVFACLLNISFLVIFFNLHTLFACLLSISFLVNFFYLRTVFVFAKHFLPCGFFRDILFNFRTVFVFLNISFLVIFFRVISVVYLHVC